MLAAVSAGAAGYTLPHAAHTTPRCKTVMAEAPKIWTPDDIAWTPKVFGATNDRDLIYGPMTGKYCEDLSKVVRRKTRTVTAGPVKFGSEHPIVRQTMGTTSTKDVKGTIDQVMRCADEGFGAPVLSTVHPCIHARTPESPALRFPCAQTWSASPWSA